MYKAIFIAVIVFVVTAIALNNDFSYMHHGEAKFVYDTNSVDETLVQNIHQYLLAENVYENKSGELFLLKKAPAGIWLLKFPVYQGSDAPPELLAEIEKFARGLKRALLNNEPLEIHITNASYQSVSFFKV